MLIRSEKILNNAKQMIPSEKTIIRVGTSLMQPHCILQSRWRQVADQAPEISLQLEPYQDDYVEFQHVLSTLGESIDVIPCIYDEPSNTGRYNILHLADQPVRIGVPSYHPLARKPCLGRKDLNGQTILLVKTEKSPVLRQIKQDFLYHCSDVRIEEITLLNYSVYNQAVNENKLIVTVECLQNVHPMIRTVPVVWKHTLHSGLIYPLDASPAVRKFIHLLDTPGV